MIERGVSGQALGFVGLVALVAVAVAAVALLGGCDSPAAQRARAEGQRELAEAQAYQIRSQANTEAAAERSAIRQAERDAAHQRTVDLLPFVMSIAGGGVVVVLVLVLAWDLRSQRGAQHTDPALLVYLAERDREVWRAIAQLERRATLPAGDGRGEVVIYKYNERL